MARNPSEVFIVYGRNARAHAAVVQFVRALGLRVREFGALAADLGGAPFVGDVVNEGLERAQAVVVVLTPDELTALLPALRGPHDRGSDTLRLQPRANVIFEAGMALGRDEKRTILVTIGHEVGLFSDIAGRHVLALSNAPEARENLRARLVSAGCAVEEGAEYLSRETAGDFDAAVDQNATVPQDPFQPARTIRWDIFLSAPMAAYANDEEYRAGRAEFQKIFTCLVQCGYRVFWAAEKIVSMADFDIAGVPTGQDLKAVSESRYFVLVYPRPLPTSALFEAGYAFALGKPSAYFARTHDLPYLLRDLPNLSPGDKAAIGAQVIIHNESEWDTCEDIAKLIDRHHRSMFPGASPGLR